jgi:hypothetical protein
LQLHGLVVDTCLKQFSKGKSLHGIVVPENNITIPFHPEGCISYLPIHLPTDAEMDASEWVWLMSEDNWNRTQLILTKQKECLIVLMQRSTLRTSHTIMMGIVLLV